MKYYKKDLSMKSGESKIDYFKRHVKEVGITEEEFNNIVFNGPKDEDVAVNYRNDKAIIYIH